MSLREHTTLVGEARHLVATLTLPAGNATPALVVLLTNSGVIPRSGPHRMNVHIARQLARMGVASVRFDLSGLGDSGRPENARPLMEQWVADTRAVMDHVATEVGCDRFAMIGFCSGAEVAHWVGQQDRRLCGALLWDLYAYPTAGSQWRALLYRMRRAGAMGLVRKAWERVQRRVATGTAAPASPPPAPSTAPAKADYMRRLQTLVDQDVDLLVVFSEGHPLWFNHAGQFRTMFKGAAFLDKVQFRYLDVADHLLTTPLAQKAFLDMSTQWLQDRLLPRSS